VHTDASDGEATLREMVLAARARRYAYVAITDHTKALRVVQGLDGAGFRRQRSEIDALQRECPDITILQGAEVDILEDGRLDLDDESLGQLDVVVAAVHTKVNMPEARMTDRVLRALAHPRVQILAHPTGRLLGSREPYAIDMAKVIAAARDRGVLLEINAQPARLDLSDTLVHMARDAGVRLVIDTDAHRTSDLALMSYGVDQARRGWCSRADVANTLPLAEFRAILRGAPAVSHSSSAARSRSRAEHAHAGLP